MKQQSAPRILHESELGRWELESGLPHPGLCPLVLRYTGYVERETDFASRLEMPAPQVVMIINLGPAIEIVSAIGPGEPVVVGSFVSGLYDRSVLVKSAGPMRCIQIDLTPIGARLLLNQPMCDYANQSIGLRDVFGAEASLIEEEIDAETTWPARFGVLDRILIHRFHGARPVAAGVSWGWNRLLQSGGQIPIRDLAFEIGWSRKHLAQKFQEDIGLSPKAMARIVRFDRAVRLAAATQRPDWLEIAHTCGYADQSHFNREFRGYAGMTPGEFWDRRIPDGGVRGE